MTARSRDVPTSHDQRARRLRAWHRAYPRRERTSTPSDSPRVLSVDAAAFWPIEKPTDHRSHQLCNGHHRLHAWLALGLTSIPVLIVSRLDEAPAHQPAFHCGCGGTDNACPVCHGTAARLSGPKLLGCQNTVLDAAETGQRQRKRWPAFARIAAYAHVSIRIAC